jgi:hypothetical protein
VIYYAHDPRIAHRRERQWAPFIKERVALVKDDVKVERTLVLTKEKFDAARAKELCEASLGAVNHQEASDSTMEDCLASLRNMGLDNPERVMAIFEGIAPKVGCGGEEAISAYSGELEEALELMPGHNAATGPSNPQ